MRRHWSSQTKRPKWSVVNSDLQDSCATRGPVPFHFLIAMPEAEAYKRLERKLRRHKSSILTDGEVRLLAAEVRALFGPTFAEVFRMSSGRLEDTVWWLSLKARCEGARAARKMSLKEAALALKVPKYRLAAIEAGTLSELKPDLARQYFRFLGIEPWVRRWSRANRGLAKRAGIAPNASGRANP